MIKLKFQMLQKIDSLFKDMTFDWFSSNDISMNVFDVADQGLDGIPSHTAWIDLHYDLSQIHGNP